MILNFVGAGVQETFQKLLSLAVVLQLVPFVYMFLALVRFALTEPVPKGQYGRIKLFLAGALGSADRVQSTLFFIGLAAFFFFVYGRRKLAREIGKGATLVVPL